MMDTCPSRVDLRLSTPSTPQCVHVTSKVFVEDPSVRVQCCAQMGQLTNAKLADCRNVSLLRVSGLGSE